MTSLINRLIDRARMVCTVCGARMGECDCWTKCACGWSYRKGESCRNPDCATSGPLRPVMIECPRCHRSNKAVRDPSDPPATVTIHIECPECVESDGDMADPVYFDAAGKLIPWL